MDKFDKESFTVLVPQKRAQDLEELSELLNDGVTNYGAGFNPSLAFLLKFCPRYYDAHQQEVFPKLSNESKGTIDARIEVIRTQVHSQSFIRTLKPLVDTLEGKATNFLSPNNSNSQLIIRPHETVRKILSEAKTKAPKLWLDQPTHNRLYSEQPLPENTYVLYAFGPSRIYSLRFKLDTEVERKIRAKIIEKVSPQAMQFLPEYLESNANDSHDYFILDNRKMYLSQEKEFDGEKIFPYKELDPAFIKDIIAFRIVVTDPREADAFINRLRTIGVRMQIPGFDIMTDDYNDHTERLKIGIPGGLHYTFVSKGTHLPLEVQCWDLQSAIIDKCGEKSHDRYSAKGKKAALDYAGKK